MKKNIRELLKGEKMQQIKIDLKKKSIMRAYYYGILSGIFIAISLFIIFAEILG